MTNETRNMLSRPDWCPHHTCRNLRCIQDQMCVGRLPKREPHGDGVNTHRLCLRGAGYAGTVFDLQVHTGDLYCLGLLFDAVRDDQKQSAPAEAEPVVRVKPITSEYDFPCSFCGAKRGESCTVVRPKRHLFGHPIDYIHTPRRHRWWLHVRGRNADGTLISQVGKRPD